MTGEATAGLTVREARPADAFSLMRVYQLSARSPEEEPLFLDYRKLVARLGSDDFAVAVAESEGMPVAFVSAVLDRRNRLSKVHRIHSDESFAGWKAAARLALSLLIERLHSGERQIDVFYSTTRSLTLAEQALTLETGFKVLGIFPHAPGLERSMLNGMTAYFFPEALRRRRYLDLTLHPAIRPYYEVVREEFGLPDAVSQAAARPVVPEAGALPGLELIEAPAFVAHRFQRLKERRFLASNFYPFQEPNALITDPAQSIEIFVKLTPNHSFATLIGERIEASVSPIDLYRAACELLRSRGARYVEILNDATDTLGIECIIQSGFLPCAYVPAFRPQGDRGRDYVIFGRPFERRPVTLPSGVSPVYGRLWQEYRKLEEEAERFQ
jgi:hypothetical protein